MGRGGRRTVLRCWPLAPPECPPSGPVSYSPWDEPLTLVRKTFWHHTSRESSTSAGLEQSTVGGLRSSGGLPPSANPGSPWGKS